jgi:hypothetical protein
MDLRQRSCSQVLRGPCLGRTEYAACQFSCAFRMDAGGSSRTNMSGLPTHQELTRF